MTAGMRQTRKHGRSRFTRGMLCTLAAVGVWTAGTANAAPVAVAAPGQPQQWYLDAMRAEEMWKVTTGQGIKVAVIDTGVNASTPSLKGQVLKGLDATGAKGEETDDYEGHGTTMAELIAGTGKGGGLRGLAPGAKIIPMRVSDTEFQNKNKVNAQDASDAIRAAADSDAQIISMSMGSEFSSPETRAAAKYAQSKGKLFFASAGNNAEEGNKPEYPAAYPDVVGVASADSKGKVAEYSQHGDNVDLAAPGNDIPAWCDTKFRSYCDSGGTSPATAIASASAALIWSAHPDWTANQVLHALIDTAARDWAKGTRSNYLGHGLIRPRQIILDGKGDPGPADVSPLTNEKTGGPPASAAPSAPASSQPPKDQPTSDAVVTGSGKNAEDDSSLGLILGGVAVVVVLAGAAFFVIRRRSA
ncbi:type VII secretion-associated serine protease mycosin [Streptomyces sp. NPDC004609]|uniref:type VII secretion-associated serine protease mycosin n=1 Tax=Streptomyces sp. NPDC004609 TaxID=3364704 RepID=UPI0036951D91